MNIYRHISSLCILSKCSERCVHLETRSNFSLDNIIITSNQSGFTKGDSTVFQLVFPTISVKPKIVAKRFELYFVKLAKPVIAYGMLDYCFNLRHTKSQVCCFGDLIITYWGWFNVLF